MIDKQHIVRHAQAYWELVQEDEVVRYGTLAGLALLWLAIALANVALLGTLPLVAAAVVLLRRHRGTTAPAWDDDLEDLL